MSEGTIIEGKVIGLSKMQLALLLQSGVPGAYLPIQEITVAENVGLFDPVNPITSCRKIYHGGREVSLVTFRTFNDMVAAGDRFLISLSIPVVLQNSFCLARDSVATFETTILVDANQPIYAVAFGNPGSLSIIRHRIEWIKTDPRMQSELLSTEIKRM